MKRFSWIIALLLFVSLLGGCIGGGSVPSNGSITGRLMYDTADGRPVMFRVKI